MVVPNINCLVTTASNDQLFANADIKTSNLVFVEETLDVVEGRSVRWPRCRSSIEMSTDHLTLIRDNVNIVLLGVDTHGLDQIVTSLVGGFVFYSQSTFFAMKLEWGTVIHS